MATLIAAPYSYFSDASGAPLNGGQIFTYDAGTTTPKATFTDASGTVPASNPVILDSAGRAAIWASGAYKIVVKDSLGVTIRTTDNIVYGSATGDMSSAIYDPANIQQQLVGLTAVQSLTNKTINGVILDNLAWTSYTPTVTAASGTFTTTSAVGYYKLIGKVCFINASVTITAVGSASNATRITLPFSCLHDSQGIGRETAAMGYVMSADVQGGTNIADIRKYDGTFGVSNGYVVKISFTYETT